MTATTREELLELLTSILPPDPLAHDYFCPKCGGSAFSNGHESQCIWKRASEIITAAGNNTLEFEE